jgi:hypothetical protein
MMAYQKDELSAGMMSLEIHRLILGVTKVGTMAARMVAK